MEEEFIPYEEALALKELGFEQLCFGFYREGDKQLFPHSPIENHIEDLILAPLYQQAFRWFRENHKLSKIIIPVGSNNNITWVCTIDLNPWSKKKIESYKEAELACLRKLIEIVKENL